MTEDSADISPYSAESKSPQVEGETRSAYARPRRGFSAEMAASILGDGLPTADWPTFNFNLFANISQQLTKQQNWLSGIVAAGVVPKALIGNPAGSVTAALKPFADVQESRRRSLAVGLFSGMVEQQRRFIAAALPEADTSIWSGLADRLKGANADWQKPLLKIASISSWLGPSFEGDWFNRLKSPFTPEVLDGFRRLLESTRPPNWAEVDAENAQALVAAGWPIVWVPRGSVVGALIAAPDDTARRHIVMENVDDIIDDVANAVGNLRSEELAFLGNLAGEAVNCARNEQFGAAQATATVVADTIVAKVWKLKSNELWELARTDFDDVPIRSFLRALCVTTLARAFARFRVERGDPEPDGYNRHASIHAASERQYTTVNALLGLMTAASLLCQVDRELSERRTLSEAPAAPAAPR